MILEEHGLVAEGAVDGLDALARLREHGAPPSLIVLDLMMPRMDGWQFRRAQKLDPRLAGIPVLILSGDGQTERKAAQLGAVGYLRKPVALDALVEMVSRLGRSSGGDQASRSAPAAPQH
jgi:two-component system response regulator MprA